MTNLCRSGFAALWVASALIAACSAYADEASEKPYNVARDAGCMVCHEVESPPPDAESVLPLAPSFEQIARRYRSDPQAVDKLSSAVRDGTGPLRRDRHWEGKARFDTMYPNDGELSEGELHAIVDWILTLAPVKGAQRDPHTQHH